MDKAIERLSVEAKHQGYWLGMGRVALLRDPLGSVVLIQGIQSDEERSIALTNLALLYYADTEVVRTLADKYINKKLRTESNDYRYTINKKMDESWRKYNFMTKQLLPVWNWYRSEEKRVNGNDVTQADFIRALEESTRYRKLIDTYTRTEVFAGDKEYGLPRVTGRDIPLFLSRAEMNAFIDKKIAEFRQIAKQQFLPGEEGKCAQLTHDLAASIFIPPLSMTLSLFSILLNAFALGCAVIAWLMQNKANWKVKSTQTAAVLLMGCGLLLPGPAALAGNVHFRNALEQVSNSGLRGKVWVWAIHKEAAMLQLLK